jgi:hypothetical protein
MPWTTCTTRATGFTVTAAVWDAELVDNMNFLKEVNYTPLTSNVSVTSTTEGGVAVVSSGAITYENVPHLIEFYAPVLVAPASGNLIISLYDSTTQVGRIGLVSATATNVPGSVMPARITPTAASHTFQIKAHLSIAGTGTIQAGTGGAATNMPGWIRIRRVPT